MEFRILGELEVEEGGRAVALGGARQRALLTNLLLHAGQVVSADRLIEDLYGAHPPATAAKSLQAHVSRLRKALGPEQRLRTRGGGYVLELSDGELDLERFSTLLEEGRRSLAQGKAEQAVAMLEQALTLWRGRPLADVAYAEFAQGDVARLDELHLAAVEELIDARIALGRHGEVVGDLERLVATHPLRERLRGQLMLALYRSGRQAEALAAYQEARRALVEELGIEPGKSLRELQQAILRQDPALDLALDLAAVGTEAAAEPPRSAVVGRERELAELAAGLDDAFAGRGRLFLLVGEPGIGKSRLAEELVSRARARGARVLIGRCWEAGGAPAYWPWLQSLRACVRETPAEVLRTQLGAGAPDLSQLLPELRELFADLPEPAALESEGARFRLFEAVASFLAAAAQACPLVLVLDDLHAADGPSLLLLQFLTRQLGGSRLLVVGAYRDVDPSPADPLTAVLTELVREPVTRTLALTGFGEGDVARFIEITSGEAPSQGLVAAIHEATDGNPLFVGEIVRMLEADAALNDQEFARPLAIPQSVRDVIARRFRRLSVACNRLLVLASVLGREFVPDALARAGGVSEEQLLDILDEAMIARVVTEVPGSPGRLRFAHVLIRDTLYDGLTAARRVRLHRLAVDALEALYGDGSGPHLAELAHHSIAGSDFDKGLLYARRAGDRALQLLAFEEAARLYATALEALSLANPSDENARCELLLSLGEAELGAGSGLAAKKAFLDASEIARRLGQSHELARAAAGYGGRIVYARAGDDAHLVPLLEEGLAAVPEREVELRARLLARLAGALRDERSRDRRDSLSREAVELARRTGNPAALAYALDGRVAAILAPDTVAECLALGNELRNVGEQIGDRERIANGQWQRIAAQVMLGDIREAKSELDAASRIAHELRQSPHALAQVLTGQAMFALAAGRLAEADDLILQAFAVGERPQPEIAIPVYRLQRYALCEFQGSLEQIESAICDLVTEHPARPVFSCALGHLYAQLGRTAEATRVLDELAQDNFAALPFDMEWLYGMSLLAETSTLLGDTASAPILYGLLTPWAAFNAADYSEGSRGSISRYLGLLATMLKRWSDAAQHFEDAIKANEHMGARPWLAHTRYDYARMLIARDGPGDRERAHEHLDHALTTYRELGMELYAARASAARSVR